MRKKHQGRNIQFSKRQQQKTVRGSPNINHPQKVCYVNDNPKSCGPNDIFSYVYDHYGELTYIIMQSIIIILVSYLNLLEAKVNVVQFQ